MKGYEPGSRLMKSLPLLILLMAFFLLPLRLHAAERVVTPNQVSMINDLLEKGVSLQHL